MEFIEIDYNLFKYKMKRNHSFILYLGGVWCKNCRAINHIINSTAINNSTTIFNLDSRVGNKESIDDFRKCNNEEQTKQYKEFIDLLQYTNEETVVIEDEEFNLIDTYIPKLSVPAILAICNGKLVDTLIEEHEEDAVTLEIEKDIENKLINLFNKIDNH